MKRQRGFSLVEMMIALVLGLVLTAAATAIFVGSHRTFTTTSAVSALADSGRMASEFLNQSLRTAGNMGCTSAFSSAVTTTYNASGGAIPALYDFADPIIGYEANSTGPTGSAVYTIPPTPLTADNSSGDWTPSLPGSLTGPLGTLLPVKGSDILIVHNTLNTANYPPAVTTAALASGGTSLPISSASTGLTNGALAVVSNCTAALAFQVTAGPAGRTLGLTSVSGASNGPPGNASGGNTSFATFSTGSFVYVPTATIYYIGVGADGDGALYRADLSPTTGVLQTPVELVPDVENMQILYGAQSANAGGVQTYLSADAVGSFGGVSAVDGNVNFQLVGAIRIALLVASPPNAVPRPSAATSYSLLNVGVTPPIDTRQRQVFELTVALRNSLS